jgi:hypothetical protein
MIDHHMGKMLLRLDGEPKLARVSLEAQSSGGDQLETV